MRPLNISADDLVSGLLGLPDDRRVCILDSCGVGHLGSHLLIAGAAPTGSAAFDSLEEFQVFLGQSRPVIFTIDYELGLRLNNITSKHSPSGPLIHAAAFDALAIHDYDTGETRLAGEETAVESLCSELTTTSFDPDSATEKATITSNFSRGEYIDAVHEIQERIRAGDTYQTNLSRKLTAVLPEALAAQQVFWRLRKEHPAPFAAFVRRNDDAVISASPERFFRIEDGSISTSPIKGTRPRGSTAEEDRRLRDELLNSNKDRAENTMIVDLLRNDLGRVCEFGSVKVVRLCEIEEHPSLFHMVSTISGQLRSGISVADIIRALFPCGSITGAPKISTMRIIDEIERSPRGLSMGAIGVYMPASFGLGEFLDTSVAIRTMTVRGRTAEFNVGGGIVIDSDPAAEYEETITKSRALLSALGISALK